jgi:nitrite reductase/ring-hydroxylating ferredoxin subunit
MFNKLGGLQNYWFVIGHSSEFKKRKYQKRKLSGVPILIWRDEAKKLHAMLDVCAHKKSPLLVCDYKQNVVQCPYHGWKFDKEGKLLEIPSSPHLKEKIKCQIDTFPVVEQDGLVWIFPQQGVEPQQLPMALNDCKGKAWGTYFTTYDFETNEELLIENFMDSSHTPTIHNKIIRDDQKKTKHTITLTTAQDRVEASYAETQEKIAFGLQYILGKNLKVTHTDTFLPPNLVKVDYVMNGILRFNAFIACTEIDEGKTRAIIRLSLKFGLLNPMILSIIPFLVKKVLKQDFLITQLQFQNMNTFSNSKMHHIDYDGIFNKVNQLRQNIREGKNVAAKETAKQIEIIV